MKKIKKRKKEKIISKGLDNTKYIKERELLQKQESILQKEEISWKQKSRENQLTNGNRNTKFFHNRTINNKNINKISKTKDDQGNIIEDPNVITKIFVDYYNNTLNNFEYYNLRAQKIMLKAIPKLILVEDNKNLNKAFSKEGIRSTLFSLSPDKSPGLDGFQAFFFQNCWDILGDELCKSIEAARNLESLVAEIKNTFLARIPKKGNNEGPSDYWPTALYNTIYKILTKALTNRLKAVYQNLFQKINQSLCSIDPF